MLHKRLIPTLSRFHFVLFAVTYVALRAKMLQENITGSTKMPAKRLKLLQKQRNFQKNTFFLYFYLERDCKSSTFAMFS